MIITTIKNFTSLEQSRKLAKILPLESADMYYEEICNLPKAIIGNYILHNQCMEDKDYKKLSNPVLSPAWSLAALLGVLPDGTDIIKDKADTENEEYMCTVGVKDDIISTFGNNPVDACYEMIICLNELNLL